MVGEEVAVSCSPCDAKKKGWRLKFILFFMIIGSSRMEEYAWETFENQ